jgi:hypothetical protein
MISIAPVHLEERVEDAVVERGAIGDPTGRRIPEVARQLAHQLDHTAVLPFVSQARRYSF